MLLVIDIGNTNTVLGLFKDNELLLQWRLRTHGYYTVDELGILLRQLLDSRAVDPAGLDAAIIACVMPTMLPTVRQTMRSYFNLEAVVVGPGVRTHMPILAENPREVGADRIVNAVAAYHRFQCGLIIVDFGTATTFDVVSPKGEYLGGAIAPGLRISAEALFQQASKLPRIELEIPRHAVGRNTVTSMQSGIVLGYVGLVNELIKRIEDEVDFDIRCVATGGLAELISRECPCIEEVLPHLTLEGLRLIHEFNTLSQP